MITATPDPNGDEAPVSTEPALFYNTQTEAGMAIVVPYDGEFGDLVMNPAGGSLDITLDMTHDKTMRIDLYDVDSGVPLEGGSINLKDEDGMTVGGSRFQVKPENSKPSLFQLSEFMWCLFHFLAQGRWLS